MAATARASSAVGRQPMRIGLQHRQNRHAAAIVIWIPETDVEVVDTYERLVDDHGQDAGDAFLLALDERCRMNGLIDAKGRRTRKSRQLNAAVPSSVS